MKIAAIVITVLWAMMLSFGIAVKQPTEAEDYYNGEKNFCELSEGVRLEVCPSMRVHSPLPNGGFITYYRCDGRNSFIVTYNLTTEVKGNLAIKLLAKQKNGFYVKKVCGDSVLKVFIISKDPSRIII